MSLEAGYSLVPAAPAQRAIVGQQLMGASVAAACFVVLNLYLWFRGLWSLVPCVRRCCRCSRKKPAQRTVQTQTQTTYTALRGVAHPRFELVKPGVDGATSD